MRWHVYIIQTNLGTLYTGITTDLERRLSEHREGKKGARFFRFSSASKLIYNEQHANRSEATKRERAIKKMTHHQKLTLASPDKIFRKSKNT